MNRIKTETGTSIIIPPDEEKSDVIRIEGDPKGVAAAKTMLLEMAAKMVSFNVNGYCLSIICMSSLIRNFVAKNYNIVGFYLYW